MVKTGFNESTTTIPATTDKELIQELRDRLTEATIKCSERCLYQSAKWTAELLNSLPEPEDDDSQMLGQETPTSSYRLLTTSYDDPEEAVMESKEGPKYLLAKSYFDTKEFDRCASIFLPPAVPAGGLAVFEKPKGRTPTSTPSRKGKGRQQEPSSLPRLSQKSMFLALYARYMAGEKRKEEEGEMVLGPADGGQTVNRELPALARALEDFFRAHDTENPDLSRSQGWLEYLYGLVLSRSKQEEQAQRWFLRSIQRNPYFWGAWEELSSLLSSVDELNAQLSSPTTPQNVISLIFQVHASIDLYSADNASTTLNVLQRLLETFPTSTFLLTQLALFHYHAKDFDNSASIFQDILVSHPYRLDALDHYSNILYVMTDRPKLAFLAHLATSVDKFRPETCCVVGNYYSLCSQHEKAVMYFRRALTLDRSFLSAWTLMGHEYIELKNTHAAIESYRRAVDVNRKDYRAWYGLGQAYEVLDMGFYALFYYQRAAGLRPYDAKMWQAVGSCYAKMDRFDQAIRAYKRALVAGTYYEPESPAQSVGVSVSSSRGKSSTGAKKNTGRKLLDPETLYLIAGLYERVGNDAEASRYMDLCVAQETGGTSQSVAEAERALRKRQRREERARVMAEERMRKAKQKQIATTDEDDEQEEMTEDFGDGDTEIISSEDDNDEQQQATTAALIQINEDDGFGTGTTATTSRARLWLARYAFKTGDLDKAERLADELCQDGFEVEEAKGLAREVRGRREAVGANTMDAGE